MGKQISSGLQTMAKDRGIPLQVPQTGSMFCLFFSDQNVTQFEQAVAARHEHYNNFFHSCLNQGLYIPPSSYETCFISSAHGAEDVSKTLEIFEVALSTFG